MIDIIWVMYKNINKCKTSMKNSSPPHLTYIPIVISWELTWQHDSQIRRFISEGHFSPRHSGLFGLNHSVDLFVWLSFWIKHLMVRCQILISILMFYSTVKWTINNIQWIGSGSDKIPTDATRFSNSCIKILKCVPDVYFLCTDKMYSSDVRSNIQM